MALKQETVDAVNAIDEVALQMRAVTARVDRLVARGLKGEDRRAVEAAIVRLENTIDFKTGNPQ